MHTTRKGDLFEGRVFNLVKEMIAQGTFIINGGQIKVFAKKKYYSQARKGNIIIDVSVEVSRPGATTPNMYIFIECKDYGKSIPVDDIEEFYLKIDQISGVNAKGLFFTTANIQSGALNFAQSKGIGVVRVNPDNDVKWFAERQSHFQIASQTALRTNVLQGLLNELYVHPTVILALNNNDAFVSIQTLLPSILKSEQLPE